MHEKYLESTPPAVQFKCECDGRETLDVEFDEDDVRIQVIGGYSVMVNREELIKLLTEFPQDIADVKKGIVKLDELPLLSRFKYYSNPPVGCADDDIFIKVEVADGWYHKKVALCVYGNNADIQFDVTGSERVIPL